MKYQTEQKDDILFIRLEGDLIASSDTQQMIEGIGDLQEGRRSYVL
ncbi:hypothetical protein GCM10028895_45510 [Pontibacter rugosus]